MKDVVIGATGGIGAALADGLEASGRSPIRIGRQTTPALDLLDEASIEAAATAIGPEIDLIIDATGFLHSPDYQPEKSYRQLDPVNLAINFSINAIGPALLMKHFLPLLSRTKRSVFATLSARVGSIEDNHLGGWYGYRASKAALNQFVRTASIELARTNKMAICIALHPGTVDTALSSPFAKTGLSLQTPSDAAQRLLSVIDQLKPGDNGQFVDAAGQRIPF
jgi:NAD(P)-dependent dehydrogenase (short-subunit alcohol dehydrogenase family)